MNLASRTTVLLAAATALSLAACGGGGSEATSVAVTAAATTALSPATTATRLSIGEQLFHEAVAFYATRDIDPARWYPLVNGQPDRFNDLPVALRGNVIQTPPFGFAPGMRPRLGPQDVAHIVAFLRTLTDDLSASTAGTKVTP